MVDVEIFSRRLDALDGYLERLQRLGEAPEREYLAEPGIHDLAARWSAHRGAASRAFNMRLSAKWR